MNEDFNNDDPISTLLKLSPKTGKLELDEDGYERFVPSEEEAAALGAKFKREINETLAEQEAKFNQYRVNLEAYHGKPRTIGADAGRPVLTLPIVGREVDQMVAGEVTTIMRPRPIISFDPYLPASYEVMASTQMPDPATGISQEVPFPRQLNAEDVGKSYEIGFDWLVRERMGFRKWIKAICKDLHIYGKSVAKTVYDRQYKDVYIPKVVKSPAGWATVSGKEKRRVKKGESCKWLNVSIFNFLMRGDENDVEEADWVAERIPMSTTALREKLSSGEYDLVPKEEWDKLLKKVTREWMTPADKAIRQTVDQRLGDKVSERHDVYEVWFYHPVQVEDFDAEGKKQKRWEILSLLGHFHAEWGRFMMVRRQPNDYGERPYTIFFEDEDQHRHSSTSVVERAAMHQALASQMLHLDIENEVQINNSNWYCDPDSEAWPILKRDANAPGKVIPRRDSGEVERVQGVQTAGGLMNHVQFVMADLDRTTGVGDWKQGIATGANRTPAATVSQIMEQGTQKPLMVLQAISDGVSRVMRQTLELKKQYEPLGEIVPLTDPETKELLEVAMRYPIEACLDNFRIALTAADQELAKEAEFEELMMTNSLITQTNQVLAQIAGPLADPMLSPALANLFAKLFETQIEAARLPLELRRKDTEKFLPSKAHVDAILQEREMAMAAAQEQQMMGEMGGGPAGAVPPDEGADQGVGMGGGGEFPPGQGVPQGAPV